ncbi:MAG: class I SAM-dependent rRNA methyltransferase [Erysipelotrichaceae bacterium]|nr:class I SAM-dependent rRNA methyltransferase [Erysipelotrichaceae bacterium]
MIKIRLKKGEGRTVSSGGLWVYDNEIAEADGTYLNGEIVEVVSYKDDFIGYGYINDHSKIRIRLLSRHPEVVIDNAFFHRLLENALRYRLNVLDDLSSFRVVFSDADRLPGLIVDKYEDILVFEIDTLGMDVRKDILTKEILSVFAKHSITIKGIYERSDSRVRSLEGLDKVNGPLYGECPEEVIIQENGIRFIVDIANGQKTGHFLDQKENHYAIRNICREKKVLDCCTHTGGFALSAAVTAKEVIGIDASKTAIDQAIRNSELNGFCNTRFIVADVFDYLNALEDSNEKFDVIILDPPAFTKSRNSVKNASKGYREINYRAMKCLKSGGFLVSCSCSEYITRDLFTRIIFQSANDAHKRLKMTECRAQSKDHPIILGNNISEYLKCMIFEVSDR